MISLPNKNAISFKAIRLFLLKKFVDYIGCKMYKS